MPRKRRPPRPYRRKGRAGWWGRVGGKDHVPLADGADDESAALEDLAQRLRESGGLLSLAPGETALAELFRDVRARAETNHTTKTAYELHLNLRRVLTWLEERGISSARGVDVAIVEDYKTARRFEQVSAARINRELDSWRKAWKLAVEKKQALPASLAAFVKLREPRPEPHRRGLSKPELERFLRAVKAPGYRALFRTVLGSGLRDEELRHLEAGDLRRAAIVVTPKDGWTTKGYRFREIPASKKTLEAARKFLAAKASLNMDKKRVWEVMQEGCRAAKVKPFSLHDLRRAFASHLYATGKHSLEDISAWLGHADVITTTRYLRIVRAKAPKPSTLPW
jgi:integrase